MEKQRSLQSLLRDHKVSADEFFQPKAIAAQIRTTNSLSRFVKYCRTHRNFATRMIYLGLNVSCAQLEDSSIKKAAFSITQLLGNEETQIIQLFFETDLKTQSQSSEIPQELQSSIQSEAQRLFRFDSDEQQTSTQQPRPTQITGKELIDFSFEILKNPLKNETCLGHLQKIFSYFIRHDPIPVLAYFEQRPQIVKLLINNLSYSSISSLLAQVLTSQDKKKQYKYQKLKKSILVETIQTIFQKLEDQNYFDGALIFLEEILNTSKQSYYQYFEDFKRIANYLVSSPVLGRFYDELLKLNQLSFSCISKFLQSLFSRMNTEVEDSSYYGKEEQGPSMSFQIQVFTKNVATLISLVPKVDSFNSLTKISYLSFLEALLSSNPLKSNPFSLNDPSFQGLFQAYKAEKNGGIVKSKIYSLLNKILQKSPQNQIKEFLQQRPNLYELYFGVIQAANYGNTKIYNKNEKSAFDVSLISQLTRKQQQALSRASKIIGKDFKRICKKYETKIASFQNNSPFILQQQYSFGHFNSQNTNKINGQNGITSLSLNFVGKNNISIPLLHLPQKSNASQQRSESRSNERREINQRKEASQSREVNQRNERNQNLRIHRETKEVFEVEEVVVLTEKIDQLQLRDKVDNQTQIEPILFNHIQQVQKIEELVKQEAKLNTQKKQNNTLLLKIPNLKLKFDAEKKMDQKNEAASPKKQQDSKKTNQNSINQEKARFFSRHLKIYI